MRKTVGILILLVVLVCNSCKKENSSENSEPRLKVNRKEIKEKMKLHSNGLDFYFDNQTQNTSFVKRANVPVGPVGPPPETGGGGGGTPFPMLEAQSIISDFLSAQNIQQTNELHIIPKFESPALDYYDVSDYGKFSRDFYEVALMVTSVEPDSYSHGETLINSILQSQKFLGLNQLEQTIIVAGAETLLDSYSYWANRLGNEMIANSSSAMFKNQSNLSSSKKAFDWNSLRKTLHKLCGADAAGGIGGGIAGAVGGAVVGSLAGGVGAAPGAFTGAIGGAVTGAVGNSVRVFIDPFAEQEVQPTKLIFSGLAIPTYWDKFVFDKSTTNVTVPNIFGL